MIAIIRLPAEIENRLETLAKTTGRTKTFYAREAIIEHIDDLEDLCLAEARTEKLHSLEEVMKEYDLKD